MNRSCFMFSMGLVFFILVRLIGLGHINHEHSKSCFLLPDLIFMLIASALLAGAILSYDDK